MCLSIFNSLGHYGTAAGIYYLNFHHFLVFSVLFERLRSSTIFEIFDFFRWYFLEFFLSWIFLFFWDFEKCRGRGWRRGWIRNGQEDALSTSFNHYTTRLTYFAIMTMVKCPYGNYEKIVHWANVPTKTYMGCSTWFYKLKWWRSIDLTQRRP